MAQKKSTKSDDSRTDSDGRELFDWEVTPGEEALSFVAEVDAAGPQDHEGGEHHK